MGKTLSVAAIKDGTVIDHIPCGQAFRIIRLLKLDQAHNTISLGLHLKSSSRGLKDLIKIENRFLSEKEAHDVAVFAPHATINIIKNYKISSKIIAELPGTVTGILICPNLCCITQCEKIVTIFVVEEFKNKIYLRCYYCEKFFERDVMKDNVE